ncbi:MAG: hypothetical protein ACTSXZ_00915 [Alphaproteobacteria bacterium]
MPLFLPKRVAPEKTAPVLYIHPRSQLMMKEIIPLSLPAVINRVAAPVVGRFEDELTAEQVRAARVVVMDIHWYLTLPAALKLAARVKVINPTCRIIAGGLTASIFARQLVRDSKIDYVVTGDAEGPLPMLVSALLDNGDAAQAPNVVGRDFTTPRTYCLTPEVMDTLDYNNVDFFPTLKERLRLIHAQVGDRPISTHPYCLAFRGCPMDCTGCIGAAGAQMKLFGRRSVWRSAGRLREELAALAANPDVRYVNFFHDFIGLAPPEYTAEALSQRYELNLYYEFFTLPTPAGLGLLLDAFPGGRLIFSADRFHTTSTALCAPDELIARIRQAQQAGRFRVHLAYSKIFMQKKSEYRETIRRVYRATRCLLWEASCWWSDCPELEEMDRATDEEFAFYAANKGRRFPLVNFACQSGLFLQRLFPRLVNQAADRLISSGVLTKF